MLDRSNYLLLSSLLFATSCTLPVRQDVDLSAFEYRRTIELEVNDEHFTGSGVASKSTDYRIKGKIDGSKFDALYIETCHGDELLKEKEGSSFEYTYRPIKEVELGKACPLEFKGLDKERSKHSFGFLDFFDERHTLKAKLFCNRTVERIEGVGVCEALETKTQRIEFTEPVVVAVSDKQKHCDVMQTKDKLVYEWDAVKGDCLYVFATRSATMRLTVHGYNRNVLRKL